MLALAFGFVCALLNRWRGGGWPGHVWGAPWLIPSLVLSIIVTLLRGWAFGLVSGAGYAIWAMEGWGGFVSIGRSQVMPHPEIKWIDDLVRPRWGWGWQGDAAGLFLRQLYAFPFFIACSILGHVWSVGFLLPFAFSVTLIYTLAFRFCYPERIGVSATEFAEYGTGMIWGLSIGYLT